MLQQRLIKKYVRSKVQYASSSSAAAAGAPEKYMNHFRLLLSLSVLVSSENEKCIKNFGR
jgi:hypothetical protein